jgi:hypothetical protein
MDLQVSIASSLTHLHCRKGEAERSTTPSTQLAKANGLSDKPTADSEQAGSNTVVLLRTSVDNLRQSLSLK